MDTPAPSLSPSRAPDRAAPESSANCAATATTRAPGSRADTLGRGPPSAREHEHRPDGIAGADEVGRPIARPMFHSPAGGSSGSVLMKRPANTITGTQPTAARGRASARTRAASAPRARSRPRTGHADCEGVSRRRARGSRRRRRPAGTCSHAISANAVARNAAPSPARASTGVRCPRARRAARARRLHDELVVLLVDGPPLVARRPADGEAYSSAAATHRGYRHAGACLCPYHPEGGGTLVRSDDECERGGEHLSTAATDQGGISR